MVGVVHPAVAVEERLGVGGQDRVGRNVRISRTSCSRSARSLASAPSGWWRKRDAGIADDRGGGPLLGLAERPRARAGRRPGPRRPASPLVQHTSQPTEPSSIQRAAVAGRPEVGVVGVGDDDHEAAGRQAWAAGGSRLRRHLSNSPRVPARGASGGADGYDRGVLACGRGFARLPPRAKPLCVPAAPNASCRRRLELVEGREDLRRVALGLDLRPDPRDPAVGIDQERGAADAHVRLAVVLLLDPRAVGLGDRVVLVGQQRERQAELLAERALAGGALRADAPDLGAALGDRPCRVAELAGLGRAAGRVVLRVEVQDGPAATLVGEVVDGARVIGQGDLGGRVADGSACSWPRA